MEFGYALSDIVTEISILIADMELPDVVMAHLLSKLSTLEFHLSHGTSEKIQLGAFVGAFTVARNML